MPNDSTRLNVKATPQNKYDAIIVGSGISGGWAAKELPWDFKSHLRLSREDIESHPIQSRHYSFKKDNKHFYISDQDNPYQETKRFDWIRGDTVGGRSLLWARACYRWSDLDFEANLKDGHSVDAF